MSYPLSAARRAPLVIAQVNPRMPRTLGNAFLHRSQVDCFVEVDQPLRGVPAHPGGGGGAADRRATWPSSSPTAPRSRWGSGSIPQAVMEALAGKRDLGVHSLLVDHMLPLLESGAINNSRKRLHRGRMDVGEIMGTGRLFAWGHENPPSTWSRPTSCTIRRSWARSATSSR